MNDPFSQRRQLLAELKRLREQAGVNQRQTAQALEWSASKFNRIEKGKVSISVSDLRALLSYYEVDDEELIESLVDMARGARARQLPLGEFKDLPKNVVQFFANERAASSISELELLVVPGLLQTSDYTRELLQSHGLDEERINLLVHSREIRQQIFETAHPPRMSFLVDESVLSRAIGGPEVMEVQLHRLVELNERPQVSIQVLPLSLGAHPGLRGPFMLLEFPGWNDPDIVYIEHRRGDSILEDEPAVTDRHKAIFRELQRRASPPTALSKYADRALDNLRAR